KKFTLTAPMSKRKKSDSKKEEKPKVAEDLKEKERADAQKAENSDFGGLPQRDLKKNLGCG
ncbi:MAG TPA: hypothetical protein VFZ52_05720, partial [Chryseolinea sp.]